MHWQAPGQHSGISKMAAKGKLCRKTFALATHSFHFTDWLDRVMMIMPMPPTEGKAHRGT